MKIGYSRPGSPSLVAEMIEKTTRAGYDGFQLKGGQYTPWLDKTSEFKTALDTTGIMGIIVYGHDLGNVRKSVGFAGDLGLTEVTWVPSWNRDDLSDSAFRAAAGTLNEIGNFARERGVRLSLHNHAGQLFQTVFDMAKFCEIIDPDTVGLTIDTAHLALGGVKDIPDVIRNCRDHIYLMHIKDLDDNGFCPLGKGTLDFDAIFTAVAEIGFDGWLVVDDESVQMPIDEALPFAMEFMRKYI